MEALRLFMEFCEASKSDLLSYLRVQFLVQCVRAGPRRGAQVHECSNDIPVSMFDAVVRQLSFMSSVNASVRELYVQDYYDDGTIVWRRNNLRGRLRETLTTFYDADLRLPGSDDDKACLVAQVSTVSRSYPDKHHTSLAPPYLVRNRMRQTFVLAEPTSILIHCDEIISDPTVGETITPPSSSSSSSPASHSHSFSSGSLSTSSSSSMLSSLQTVSLSERKIDVSTSGVASETKKKTPRTTNASVVGVVGGGGGVGVNGSSKTATKNKRAPAKTRSNVGTGVSESTSVVALPGGLLRLPEGLLRLPTNVRVVKREISIETVADRAWQDPCARNAVDILTEIYRFLARLPETARALGHVVRPLHQLVPHLHSTFVLRNHKQPFSRPLSARADDKLLLPDKSLLNDSASLSSSSALASPSINDLAEASIHLTTDDIVYKRRHLITAYLVRTAMAAVQAFRINERGFVELEWRAGRLVYVNRRPQHFRAPLSPPTQISSSSSSSFPSPLLSSPTPTSLSSVLPSPLTPSLSSTSKDDDPTIMSLRGANKRRASDTNRADNEHALAKRPRISDDVNNNNTNNNDAGYEHTDDDGGADQKRKNEDVDSNGERKTESKIEKGGDREQEGEEVVEPIPIHIGAKLRTEWKGVESKEKEKEKRRVGADRNEDTKRDEPRHFDTRVAIDENAGEKKERKDGDEDRSVMEDEEEAEEEEEEEELAYVNGLSRDDFFACVKRMQSNEIERDEQSKWFEDQAADVWIDTLDYFLQDEPEGGGGGDGGGRKDGGDRGEYRATAPRNIFGGRSKKKNYKMQCVTKKALHTVDYELGCAATAKVVDENARKREEHTDFNQVVAGYAVRMSAKSETPRPSPFPFVPQRNSVRLKRRMTRISRKPTQAHLSLTIVKSARGKHCTVLNAIRSPHTSYELEVEIPSTPYNREIAKTNPKQLVTDAVALLLDVLEPVIDVAGIQPL
jgi:hypothetical protein